MFDWCIKNIEGISFLLVSSEKVEEIIIFKPVSLKNNMPNFLTNSKGSRTQFHTKRKHIVNENYIQRFPSIRSFATKLSVPQSSLVLNPPGIYIACLYEGEWFIKFLTKHDVDV